MVRRARQTDTRDASEMVIGVLGNSIAFRDGTWWTHHSFGRIVELIAQRVREVRYNGAVAGGASAAMCDFPFDDRKVTIHPWEVWRNTMHAMKRPDRLIRRYRQMVRECDVLFLRGSNPLVWTAHLMAAVAGKPIVHWIVGNPVAIMKSEARGYGSRLHWLGVQFARWERLMTRLAARVSGAYLLTNGAELAHIFGSKRTIEVVSSSITESDFLVRDDVCLGEAIRILFVGFIRPEKGLEYLLRAMPQISTRKNVQLAIVGSWDQFSQERDRLVAIIDEMGLADRVSWEGYASFGRELFDQMDRSDLLVLPSLAEGTPRVLVEARARSLPVISTTVGGIPSSVSDGQDGLLVPPRDSDALAVAISRVIEDGELRRGLIRCGRQRVQEWTVGRFVDLVVGLLAGTYSDSKG